MTSIHQFNGLKNILTKYPKQYDRLLIDTRYDVYYYEKEIQKEYKHIELISNLITLSFTDPKQVQPDLEELNNEIQKANQNIIAYKNSLTVHTNRLSNLVSVYHSECKTP